MGRRGADEKKSKKKSHGRRSRKFGRYPRISPYLARYLRQSYTPYTLRGLYFPNSIRNYGGYGPFGYGGIGFGHPAAFGGYNSIYGQAQTGYQNVNSYPQATYQQTANVHPTYQTQPQGYAQPKDMLSHKIMGNLFRHIK